MVALTLGPRASGLWRGAAVAAVAALACLSLASRPAIADGSKHAPPYKKGPSGGDEFNYIHTDRETGEIAIFRVFPGIPPVVGCVPQADAGWAMFRVPHRVTAPVSTVTVQFDGTLDPYSWVTVGARDSRGEWLGVAKYQGPHAGAGKLKAKLFAKPRPGDEITLEFGLQLGDACPQVGGAAAEFASVSVD